MPAQPIALPRARLRELETAGFRLPGLAATGAISSRARFEGPTTVISTVPTGAFLDVGAFCNLSGGEINNVRIGRYCSIAKGAVLGPHEHPTDWLTTSRTAYFPQVHDWDVLMAGEAGAEAIARQKRPFRDACPLTTLGPDVWIGQGAFVKAGVTIGAGAIVGARATVLRDVPPYAIVVGTPARVIRLRFPEAVVERLLASEWWRYSIYDLFEAPLDDVAQALDLIETRIADGALQPYAGPVLAAADLAPPAPPVRVAS
jgi:acetyltransferase-like isoleucine patch superfamily enzyme